MSRASSSASACCRRSVLPRWRRLGGQATSSLTPRLDLRPCTARQLQRAAVRRDVTWLDARHVPARRGGRARVEWIEGGCGLGHGRRCSSSGGWSARIARVAWHDTADGAAAFVGERCTLNPRRPGAARQLGNDLLLLRLRARAFTRLTSTRASEEEATFSPDGRRVAFVRANNLYVVDVASQRERALTTDGHAQMPQRQARLALPGRDLRPRTVPRATGGARTPRGSRSCSSTSARCRSTRWSTTSRTGRRSRSPTIRRPAIRIRSVKLGDRARRRRRSCSGSTSASTRAAEHLIVNVDWTPDRGSSCTRCRTASRHGSI